VRLPAPAICAPGACDDLARRQAVHLLEQADKCHGSRKPQAKLDRMIDPAGPDQAAAGSDCIIPKMLSLGSFA
jgi:hypothetical protein